MAEKSFQTVATILNKLLSNYHLSEVVEKERIFSNWKEIVGEKMARICQPVKFQNSILYVKTINSVWRNELALRQPDLLNLLAKQIKNSKVTKIIFL